MRNIIERNMAIQLNEDGYNFNEISSIMNISRFSARSLCQYKLKKNPKKKGSVKKIGKKDGLRIKRQISTFFENGEKVNSRKIKESCNLNVSTRTVQRYMKNTGFKYKKVKSQIFLQRRHKEERIRIINKWICENQIWEETIFSDEKRFSLDGPDDWRTYMPETENFVRQKRQCKGGGIMVWMMVLPNGLLCHRIIKGKFNSKDYLNMIQEIVVPIIFLNFGRKFAFQQDNASIHKAKIVMDFFFSNNINIIEWPAKSPDINITEDVWKMISDDVYDGRQFNNCNELNNAIDEAILRINNFKRQSILNLFGNIRSRLCKILGLHGNLYNL